MISLILFFVEKIFAKVAKGSLFSKLNNNFVQKFKKSQIDE
ncbi:hypothetical protein NC99_35340 [Sunxiuqinia dokdonensis]|uniref:Uncharacterized protein n=1 Tax=Sunxiuqinia dokdonensis TaxID=1409788 RepID=A0A0L8V597_9BACT|nr:hypothetical protein NC99_35340 [Sunxiuqinia dokdonensis]